MSGGHVKPEREWRSLVPQSAARSEHGATCRRHFMEPRVERTAARSGITNKFKRCLKVKRANVMTHRDGVLSRQCQLGPRRARRPGIKDS